MDIDLLAALSPDEPAKAAERQSTPLPHVTLPAYPSASVSPGASKYHTRRSSQQFTTQPTSPVPSSNATSFGTSAFATGSMAVNETSNSTQSGDAALEEEIERSRQERMKRRHLTSNSVSSAPDARDNASARENIMALASRGSQPSNSASGGANAPSLASFMGGGAKPPPRHKIGTGMTEQEREETERLEKEMEATRSKWKSSSSASEAPAAGIGGLSLANLMKKNQADTSNVKVGVAQRWGQTVEKEGIGRGAAEPSSATTSPATRPQSSTFNPSGGGPVSLAAMMGSKASGPRLNQQAAQPVVEDEGPAHARRGFAGAHALPGMVAAGTVRARAQSFSSTVNNDETTRSRSTSPVQTRSATADTSAASKPSSPVTSRNDGFTPRADAATKSSVVGRWGRDEPNQSGSTSRPSSPVNSRPPSPVKQASAPVSTSAAAPPSPVANRGWSGPPIGTRPTSKSSPWSAPIKADTPPEPKYTRGVAMPGMSASSPAPAAPASDSTSTAASKPSSPTSVRNVIAQWGTQPTPSQAAAALAAASIKESYGVKIASPRTSPVISQRTLPSAHHPSPQSSAAPHYQPRTQAPTSSAPSFEPSFEPKPIPGAASTSTQSSQLTQPKKSTSPQPAVDLPLPRSLLEKRESVSASGGSRVDPTIVSKAIALAVSAPPSSRLPPGEAASTDVYSLLTNDLLPIDHNHVLYRTEVLLIVHRQISPKSTTVILWQGDEAPFINDRIEKKIREILQKEGVTDLTRIKYRQETKALGEIFGDQITICRGLRDDFDHLATRLYSVQAHDDVVFVEEQDLTARSICSGHCLVFSIVGEVYAWMGSFSSSLEQDACFDFAETIADGRQVSVLQEGSETAYFWHGLDGLVYASAHYWKFRPLTSSPVTVIAFDGAKGPSRVEPVDLPIDHISLVDGGFAEHWVVVPQAARGNKQELELALATAVGLAGKWKERGFGFKQAVHVLLAPSRIPIDLPHLARQLDFHKLNGGEDPTKMNVLTVEEARAQFLK